MSWKAVKDEFTINDIGAPLLASLSVGIYLHQDVLREYVQNAADAYQKMESPPDDPIIFISTEDGTSLSVLDRGAGMSLEDLRQCKKIAVSSKASSDFIGFRGIGIWAGLQACEKLEIVTTPAGDPHRYRLSFDFDDILRDVKKNNLDIGQLLRGRFHLQQDDWKSDDHFTQVRLVRLTTGYQQLGLPAEVKRIASQVLPSKLDPKHPHASEISDFCRKCRGYREYDIYVDDEPVYREFPDARYQLETRILKSGKTEYARAWYCTGDGTLKPDPDSNQIRGFRLRVKNFAVGEPNLYSAPDGTPYGVSEEFRKLQSPVHLNWHCGEVHITNPEVTPNAPRRELEPSEQAIQAIELIRDFYNDRIGDSRALAGFNGMVKRLGEYDKALTNNSVEPTLVGSWIKELEEQDRAARGQGPGFGTLVNPLLAEQAQAKLRKSVLSRLKAFQNSPVGTPPQPSPDPPRPTSGGPQPGNAPKNGRGFGSPQPSLFGQTAFEPEKLLSEIIAVVEAKIPDDDDTQEELIVALQDLFTSLGLILLANDRDGSSAQVNTTPKRPKQNGRRRLRS